MIQTTLMIPANRAIWVVTFDTAILINVPHPANAPFLQVLIVQFFRQSVVLA